LDGEIIGEIYLLDRCYDNKENDFYEMISGHLSDEEYITRFLELLRYVPYLKDYKAKFQLFISRFPMSFKDRIKFYEPQTLDDATNKFKHYCEQEKRSPDFIGDWKLEGSGKYKKKWHKRVIYKNDNIASPSEG